MTLGDKKILPAGIWGGLKKGARQLKKLKRAFKKKGDKTRLLAPHAEASQGSSTRDVAPLIGFSSHQGSAGGYSGSVQPSVIGARYESSPKYGVQPAQMHGLNTNFGQPQPQVNVELANMKGSE